MARERLDKIIALCTGLSRKEAKTLIKGGAVSVDGSAALLVDARIDPEKAQITVKGEPLVYKKYIYIMLNKPSGVVSSTEERGAKTVLDLVDEDIRRRGVFPAGRLDRDTTGFVLLTDDGAFAHDILSPSKHVEKTYILTAERELTEREAALFAEGMPMDGEALMPAKLRRIPDERAITYEIRIKQGKYHQIKRMFAHVGNRVLTLRRVAMGGLLLDPNLKEGEYREITQEEKEMIAQSCANG